jgi:hypothetical protein
MGSYHFSCGNSTDGPVGLCARIAARSKGEAVRKLRRALFLGSGVAGEIRVQVGDKTIEYVNLYVSPDNVRIADIDED